MTCENFLKNSKINKIFNLNKIYNLSGINNTSRRSLALLTIFLTNLTSSTTNALPQTFPLGIYIAAEGIFIVFARHVLLKEGLRFSFSRGIYLKFIFFRNIFIWESLFEISIYSLTYTFLFHSVASK